jgi:uncharacterized protein (TIGR00369 family)
MNFVAPDLNFVQRVRESFGQQQVMSSIGAEITMVEAGQVQIRLPFRADLTQQHGYMHAGIMTTIVDSACGYAAYSLMPAESNVLTVEFKVNFLVPAKGDYFMAIGQVLKAGRTLTVCEGKVFAHSADAVKLIVAMQATLMCL